MTITITLADADGSTAVFLVHDGLPRAVATTMRPAGGKALAKLAASSRRGRTRNDQKLTSGHDEKNYSSC